MNIKQRESNTLKGQFINNVIVSMANYCDKQTLQILENVLRSNLTTISVSEDKNLPAINENMNWKILDIYLAKKSFEVSVNTIFPYFESGDRAVTIQSR